MAKEMKSIQLAVLDSVIYGAARAFDYLGHERGQEMLDRIGTGIIDYGVKLNYLQLSKDPYQSISELIRFFKDNGYVSEVEFSPDGEAFLVKMHGWRFMGLMKKLRNQNCFLLTCPLCLARGAIEREEHRGSQVLSEGLSSDGTYSFRFRNVSPADSVLTAPDHADLSTVQPTGYSNTKVGLPAFETVEYGLACGFEYLGAQAQLLLDNIGHGIIEFLRDEFHTKLPEGHKESLNKLAEFYVNQGLSDKIDIDLSRSEARFRFKNYRYSPVLKLLLEEGHPLTSCPFALAARGMFRDSGFVASDMKWALGNGRDATLAMKLRKISDQVFDEEKVASLMESV